MSDDEPDGDDEYSDDEYSDFANDEDGSTTTRKKYSCAMCKKLYGGKR